MLNNGYSKLSNVDLIVAPKLRKNLQWHVSLALSAIVKMPLKELSP